MKFGRYMIINELAYPGNIGFQEMAMFYQQANDKDIKKMENVIKDEDWDGFRSMINKVLRIKLK